MNERCDNSFLKGLAPDYVGSLESHKSVVFGLSNELKFTYFNPAWFRFAADNGGEPKISNSVLIGSDILGFLEIELREFYSLSYQNVLATNQRWQHRYECSSATRFRSMVQTVYPSPNGAGLMAVNSLVVEVPVAEHFSIIHSPIKDDYVKGNGLILQCVHCRKVLNQAYETWDFVPTWVEKMPLRVRFSFCPPCRVHYSK